MPVAHYRVWRTRIGEYCMVFVDCMYKCMTTPHPVSMAQKLFRVKLDCTDGVVEKNLAMKLGRGEQGIRWLRFMRSSLHSEIARNKHAQTYGV